MKTQTLLFTVALLVGGAAAQASQGPTTSFETNLINTDPAPVQSGEDADITFKLRNTGTTEAENVKLQLKDSFPFELKPGMKRNYSLGDMARGQEYQVSTEVLVSEDAPDGFNSFKVEIIKDGVSRTEKIPVQVQSQDVKLNLAGLKTSPSSLTPDTDGAKLSVQVANNGERTADNTVLKLELPENFRETSSFSSRQALGNINPGEVKTAEFNFDILEEAEKGDIEIPATLSYSTDTDSSTSSITEEANFTLYLSGKPQFEVKVVDESLKTGKTGELKLEVKNTGSEKSESTRIRVLDSSDLPFDYDSSSVYIGTLEPGEKGTAVFDVTTEREASVKKYLIDFEVRGVKDTEVYVDDNTVQAEVSRGEKTGLNLPAVAGTLIAVLGIGYVFRDRIAEKIGL